MNKSNIGMTLNSVEFLEIQHENTVLGLDYRNAVFLEKVLKSA